MHRPIAGPLLAITALAAGACSASRPVTPVVLPTPAESLDTRSTSPSRLLLSPGGYKYHFVQNTRIKADTGSNPASMISTTARLLVDVSQHADSTYRIGVSIDSLQLTAEGQIPARPAITPISLGLVLEASVRSGNMSISTQLPDSLCAYSHLVTVARQLLLPQLPSEGSLQEIPTHDSSSISTCRGGARIDMTVIRQLTRLSPSLDEVRFQETITLSGIGTLGKDSVSVSGSITGEGVASFAGHSRLPSLVETRSQGPITVRVGGSTTAFQQNSTQQIRKQQDSLPPN